MAKIDFCSDGKPMFTLEDGAVPREGEFIDYMNSHWKVRSVSWIIEQDHTVADAVLRAIVELDHAPR